MFVILARAGVLIDYTGCWFLDFISCTAAIQAVRSNLSSPLYTLLNLLYIT